MAIKKKKSSFDFLIFLFVIAIALGSYSSYSKYTSTVSGNSTVNIAAWNVKVNTEDVTDIADLTENISFTPIESQYVAEGKIAPSVGGYFDIIIDTSDAEVASTYTININLTVLDSLEGFSVAGYEIYDADDDIPSTVSAIPDNLETASTTSNITTITREILLGSDGKGSTETVRVFLDWAESGTNPSSTTVQIPVQVIVEQYFG